MNPFITIWFSPKRTIRGIVDQNPNFLVLFLALATGAVEVAMQGVTLASSANAPLLWTIIVCAVIGGILGLIGLYFFGLLYRWIGSWFGGKATGPEVRAAIAWAKVPTFVIFGIWLLIYLIGGDVSRALTEAPGSVSAGTAALLLGQVVSSLWFGIWGFIMLCLMLGEVHHFSGWKGLVTVLIPSIVIIPVFLVIGLLAAIAIPNFIRARENALLQRQGQPSAQVETFDEEMWEPIDEEPPFIEEEPAAQEPLPFVPEEAAREDVPPVVTEQQVTDEPPATEPLPFVAEEPVTGAPPLAPEELGKEPEPQVWETAVPAVPGEAVRQFHLRSGERFEGEVVFDGGAYLRVKLTDGTERVIFRDELASG